MNERYYRLLKYPAIILTAVWIGWFFYDTFFASSQPGEYAYQAGSNYFADGYYEKALAEYDAALAARRDYIPALRGRAETLIMLKREREAVAIYDDLIARQPDGAGHYANRGIARDRLGEYEQALADYRKSLSLDDKVGEGPGWLIRFLRNQPEKPPGIAERARFLREQLARPPAERLLRVPELDEAQRPYKQ